jgi:hypothetical protein
MLMKAFVFSPKRRRGQGVQAVEATLAQLRILEAFISLESDGNPLFENSG